MLKIDIPVRAISFRVPGKPEGWRATVGKWCKLSKTVMVWNAKVREAASEAGLECPLFVSRALGIFTFQIDASTYVAEAHWIFKLHLFLGLTIFLVFPFTRLVHMLSAPLRYIWRPGYQVVRTRRRRVARAAPRSVRTAAE